MPAIALRRWVVLVFVGLAGTGVAAGPALKSVWKASDISKLEFAGKKIAALVITDDLSLQMSGEEALVRELSARGVTGVATYRIVPAEQLRSPEGARPWYERAGAQGVVAVRPVSRERSRSYRAVAWGGYYQDFWSYYSYSWQSLSPVSTKIDTIIVVEILVYDLGRNRLVWAATSDAKNPAGLQSFVADLINGAVREMQRLKLISQDAVRR
jgi:hypothetical protein